MLLGLETFSYHLAFAYGEMDIFNFIERTANLGLDGVQINVEGQYLSHLGSDDSGFLRDVRAMIHQYDMFVELDTCGTKPEGLARVLGICHQLGADKMRVYSSVGGDVKNELKQAIVDFRQVISICADYGVKIAFENHEYETSQDVLNVVKEVGSEWIGTHVDTGNSMMVWEEPVDAVKAMAPYAVSTHFKDHMVIMVGNQPMIIGVPLGKGSLDCPEIFKILAQKSQLERINIEVCYGYIAPFRLPEHEGFGAKLGRGCFKIIKPPYDPEVVAPYLLRASSDSMGLESHAWQELANAPHSDAERRELLAMQDRAVIESVEYVKKLNCACL